MSTFQPPNFDRIHAYLEERLGTSDVSLRYGNIEGGNLVISSNEILDDGRMLSGIFTYACEFNPLVYFVLESLSKEGPGFKRSLGFNGSWAISSETYEWVERNILKVHRGYGFSLSQKLAARVAPNYQKLELLALTDAVLAHEGMHAAIDRSDVLEQFDMYTETILSEAIPMRLTLDYLDIYDPEGRKLYHDELVHCANRNASYRTERSHSAFLAISNAPTIEENIVRIKEANRRLTR